MAPRALSAAGVVIALAGGCARSSPGGVEPAPPTARPNIVLIVADDLGYGEVGAYGQSMIATPRLDALAGDGVRLTQAYAGSTVCAPSRCVLMTGLHAGHCRVRGNHHNARLKPNDVTIAEVLAHAGYRTGMFGKWALGELGSEGVPTAQGFDEFYGYLNQGHAHNYYPSFLIDGTDRQALDNVVPEELPTGAGVATVRNDYAPALIVDRAVRFIHSAPEPLFVYLPFTLPHVNNEAGERGALDQPDLGRYADRPWPAPQIGQAAMVTRFDTYVGAILDALDERGIAGNTLVIVTSDNGPHAEGGVDPTFFDANGPWRGIKRSLYEGGIRVPFIARWPGRLPAGTVLDAPVHFTDLLPTCAAAAGIRLETPTDGVDLLPVLAGAPAPARVLYWEAELSSDSLQAARFGRYKAIASPIGSDDVAIYDLDADPGEEHDLAPSRPSLVDTARRHLRSEHTPPQRPPTPPEQHGQTAPPAPGTAAARSDRPRATR